MPDLTIKAFSERNRTRYNRDFRHPDWEASDWATAVAGEVGEACNLIKKMRRGEKTDPQEIAYELADAVTYIDLLLSHLGYELSAVLVEKFNIVSDRIGSDVKIRGYTYGDPYVSTDGDAAAPPVNAVRSAAQLGDPTEAQERMKRLAHRRAALRRSIDNLESKISGNRCTDGELAWAQHYANLARDVLACRQLLEMLEPQAPIPAAQ